MAITRINDFKAAAGKEGALREFLGSIIATIKGAPGCLGVELLVHVDESGTFAIVEQWESVDAHKAAASRIPPALMATFMPLIAEPPKGRYYTEA